MFSKEILQMQSHHRIRSGFNFIAPAYDFFSLLFFGNSILHSQTFLLQELKKCQKALVFGGGSGKLLIELIKLDAAESYCYVDLSDKMIAIAKRRLEKFFPDKINSVNFICGSSEDMSKNEKFDLIITPYILDCITEEKLPTVLMQLKQHLNPKGKWLFTDFNIPEKQNNSTFSLLRVRVMYFGFNVICKLGMKRLPNFKKEFSKLNYIIEHEKSFLNGFQIARIYREKLS